MLKVLIWVYIIKILSQFAMMNDLISLYSENIRVVFLIAVALMFIMGLSIMMFFPVLSKTPAYVRQDWKTQLLEILSYDYIKTPGDVSVFRFYTRLIFSFSNEGFRDIFSGRIKDPVRAICSARCAPVLFLRPFIVDKKDFNPLIRMAGAVMSREQALVHAFKLHAPIIAIGSPEETTPPQGACRFYVDHEHWQSTIEQIAPCCSLVIWTYGKTPGVHWELEHIVSIGPPERILLYFDAVAGLSRSRIIAVANEINYALPTKITKIPKRACVLVFKHDWTPVFLTNYQMARFIRRKFFGEKKYVEKF